MQPHFFVSEGKVTGVTFFFISGMTKLDTWYAAH